MKIYNIVYTDNIHVHIFNRNFFLMINEEWLENNKIENTVISFAFNLFRTILNNGKINEKRNVDIVDFIEIPEIHWKKFDLITEEHETDKTIFDKIPLTNKNHKRLIEFGFIFGTKIELNNVGFSNYTTMRIKRDEKTGKLISCPIKKNMRIGSGACAGCENLISLNHNDESIICEKLNEYNDFILLTKYMR